MTMASTEENAASGFLYQTLHIRTMGFSCLLGHDFGHPKHEQEQERHGEEVVLTTRDVKTCRRCGTEQILTENTAVMKRDAVPAALEKATEPEESAIKTDSSEPDGLNSNPDETDPRGADGSESAPEDTDTPGSVERDAGVTERPRDETPDAPIESGVNPAGDAATNPEDNEDGSEPEITHDAVILTDEPEERAPMEWPTFGAETETSIRTTDTGRRGTVADGGVTPGTVRDTSRLYCGNCMSTWNAGNSSLEAGDPCPDCRSAYVERRSQ